MHLIKDTIGEAIDRAMRVLCPSSQRYRKAAVGAAGRGGAFHRLHCTVRRKAGTARGSASRPRQRHAARLHDDIDIRSGQLRALKRSAGISIAPQIVVDLVDLTLRMNFVSCLPIIRAQSGYRC